MKDFYVEKESVRLDTCPIHATLQSHSKKREVIRPHIHSAIEFLIVKSGSYDIFVDERRYSAHPGDMVMLRSNTIHQTYSTTELSSYYVVKVRATLPSELSGGSDDSKYLLFFALDADSRCFWTRAELDGTPLGRAVADFTSEYESDGVGRVIAMSAAMARVLVEIMREDSARVDALGSRGSEDVTRRIYDTLLYINKNYNQPITAADCARLAGMSYSHFSRTFHKTVGKSFKEYLNFTRINHARKALMSKDMTVTEVAAHCGFDNVSYFISLYKKIKGTTPHKEKS